LSQLLLLLCADNGIAIKVERDGAEKITKQSSENLSCTHSFPSSFHFLPATHFPALSSPPRRTMSLEQIQKNKEKLLLFCEEKHTALEPGAKQTNKQLTLWCQLGSDKSAIKLMVCRNI